MTSRRKLLILGTRGVPAAHGGFETFAEQLCLFLAERGWDVSVYCQHDVETVTRRTWTDEWRGVERINIAVSTKGALGTLDFDWRCVVDAGRRDALCLVLGYNSALFLPYLRMMGKTILTNMDGLEWRRDKWSRPVKTWFWINEWIAAWSSQHLIADHPAIADHLATRRSRSATVMIPYGGIPIENESAEPLAALGLESGRYLVSIARIEPENNILTLVEAFAKQPHDAKLVVLGKFDAANPYHCAVKAAAGPNTIFPGAIYDQRTVRALRYHARAYLHGHTVGGTNPSLVESLWASNAVIAHNNAFNRWTAGPDQFYFADAAQCDAVMTQVLVDDTKVATAKASAKGRAMDAFGWPKVLSAYEAKFLDVLKVRAAEEPAPRESRAL